MKSVKRPGGDDPPISILPALDLADERRIVIDAFVGRQEDCLVGDNFAELPDPELERHRIEYYGEKPLIIPPVQLVRLPAGARLCGGESFLVRVDGVLVEEQVPPMQFIPQNRLREAALSDQEAIVVPEPAVLVSRFGYMTWGHWIGELLPRAALTEARFPGEFTYVVPIPLVQANAPRNVFNAVAESLEAAGVGRERWLLGRYDRDYSFDNLHILTDLWMGPGLHPEALRRMREILVGGRVTTQGRRIALLRAGATRRAITNLPDLITPLRTFGFEFVELSHVPFLEQVHLFATAQIVVSVLASELSGLFLAPERAGVLTLAPEGYLNSFFYSMICERRQVLYDVRGAITAPHPESAGYSGFSIHPAHLDAGLQVLGL